MLYTKQVSKSCSTPGVARKKTKTRSKAYDTRQTGKLDSVYSSQSVIELVYSAGICKGCFHDTGRETTLVNGYCLVCRSNGANEQQCLDPRDIQKRSNISRQNSQESMWRYKHSKRMALNEIVDLINSGDDGK